MDRCTPLICGLWAVTLLGGCGGLRVGGDQSPDQVIHDLRREKMALTARLDHLEEDIGRRLEQIDQLKKGRGGGRTHVEGVQPADLPRLVDVQLGRYSGPLDTNGDGRDDLVRLYVRTLDQQGRFLPVVGRGDAQAVLIRTDGPPVVVGRLNLPPTAFNAAYRSGLMGTHYRLDVPVDAGLGKGDHGVTVKMTVTDAATGGVVNCETSMVLRVRQ